MEHIYGNYYRADLTVQLNSTDSPGNCFFNPSARFFFYRVQHHVIDQRTAGLVRAACAKEHDEAGPGLIESDSFHQPQLGYRLMVNRVFDAVQYLLELLLHFVFHFNQPTRWIRDSVMC